MVIHKENFLIDGRIVVYEDLSFAVDGVGKFGKAKGKIVRNMHLPKWVEAIIAKGPEHAVLPLRVDKVEGRFVLRGKEVILSVREEASKPCMHLYVKGTNPKDENSYKSLIWKERPEEGRFKEALEKGVVKIITQTISKIYSYDGKDLFEKKSERYTTEDIATPSWVEQYLTLKRGLLNELQELPPVWKNNNKGHKATREGIFEFLLLKKMIPYIQHSIQWDAEKQSYYAKEEKGETGTPEFREEQVLLWRAINSVPHTEEKYIPASTKTRTLGGDGYVQGLKISVDVPAHYETVTGDLVTYENGEKVFIPEHEDYAVC